MRLILYANADVRLSLRYTELLYKSWVACRINGHWKARIICRY